MSMSGPACPKCGAASQSPTATACVYCGTALPAAAPPGFGAQPYGAPPQPYGQPPAPYGAPPQPYGAPPQPYGGPPQPYGGPQPPPYGGPQPQVQPFGATYGQPHFHYQRPNGFFSAMSSFGNAIFWIRLAIAVFVLSIVGIASCVNALTHGY